MIRLPLPVYGEDEPHDVEEWVGDAALDGLRRWDCRHMGACAREVGDMPTRRRGRALIGWACSPACSAHEPRSREEERQDMAGMADMISAVFAGRGVR